MTEDWVSKRDLAKHLKVSTRAVDAWLREEPPVPCLTISPSGQPIAQGERQIGRRRFRISEVEHWLRERHARRVA